MAGSVTAVSQAAHEFRSETDGIRNGPEPIATRATVLILAAFLVTLVVISAFALIDKTVSSTAGKVVATESPLIFQPLDASIIKSLDVTEGQQVQAGQLLATLDSTFTAADVTQLRQQVAGLDAQIARAEAEKDRKPFAISSPETAASPYAALQRALYEQRALQYKAQINSYDEKARQIQATISKLQIEESRYKEREKISQEIESMRQLLVEKQAGSRLNLLIANDSRLELLRNMDNGHNSLIEAQHNLASVQADREAFDQQWFSTISQEIVTAANQRDTAVSQLAKAERKQDLVKLTAPEPGVVLSLTKLSVGSVAKEGEPLMTLVPLRTPMEVEARVLSRDVGFIRPGDPAVIKIDAFSFFEHGTAKGHVRWISEGAFSTDDNNQPVDPYYKLRVAIDEMNFQGVPPNFRLLPGMTLSTDINVGVRSVMRYLIGGAMRGVGESMREP